MNIFYVPIIRDFSSLVFYHLDPADRERFGMIGPLLRGHARFDLIERVWPKIMDFAATIDARRTPPSQMKVARNTPEAGPLPRCNYWAQPVTWPSA